MKRPDEAMERVLAGLRDAEAPVGMERRILERLEDRVGDVARGLARLDGCAVRLAGALRGWVGGGRF